MKQSKEEKLTGHRSDQFTDQPPLEDLKIEVEQEKKKEKTQSSSQSEKKYQKYKDET